MIERGALLECDNLPDEFQLSHLLRDSSGRIQGITTRWVLGDDPSPTAIHHKGRKIGHASPRYLNIPDNEEQIFDPDVLITTFEVLPVEEISPDFSTRSDTFPALGISECLGQEAYIRGVKVGEILHHYDRFYFNVGEEQIEVSQVFRLERTEADLALSTATTRNGAMVYDQGANIIGVICASQKPFYSIVPIMSILTRLRLEFLELADVRSFNQAVPGYLSRTTEAIRAGAGKFRDSAELITGKREEDPVRRASQFDVLLEEEA